MCYKLRYFFDFGSGVCLWSANDAAIARFDYPVQSHQLPICVTLMYRMEFILAWHDTFLDWDHAPQLTHWATLERDTFNIAAQELLHLLQKELGAEFIITDESKTSV